jgi:hypothetical protein
MNHLLKSIRMPIVAIAAAALICIPALADDAIQSSVTNVTPTAIVTPNGQGYSPGTIQILYTVVAPQFTAGPLGSFTLNLEDIQKSTKGQFPTYPTTLTLTQNGSTQLTLTPQTSSLTVNAEGWTGSTVVTVSIPDSVVADSSNAVDGTTLVGNLNASSSDSHLGTNTTIQVKIKLVVPKVTTCLNVYHFPTDEDFMQILTSVGVNQNKKGIVVATNPGQLSDNTLVVNTCNSTQNFDVNVALDTHWQTVPNNNPGNAVFTYNTAGEIDETSFNLSSFGTGTAQGQHLCIQNMSVASGDTFLMTVHMGIVSGVTASSLPTNPSTFTFTGGLYTANTNCSGAVDPLASPGVDPYSLPFSLF